MKAWSLPRFAGTTPWMPNANQPGKADSATGLAASFRFLRESINQLLPLHPHSEVIPF